MIIKLPLNHAGLLILAAIVICFFLSLITLAAINCLLHHIDPNMQIPFNFYTSVAMMWLIIIFGGKLDS